MEKKCRKRNKKKREWRGMEMKCRKRNKWKGNGVEWKRNAEKEEGL